jgi:hypothetical protein
MEELMDFIRAAFEQAWKKTDDECRYDKFVAGLEEKNIPLGVLEELLQEIQEDYNYKETYFVKPFKPAITYVGAPMYAAVLAVSLANKFNKDTDLILLLVGVTIIFLFLYIFIGGGIYAVLEGLNKKNRKHKSLVRWMQKYIRNRKIKDMLRRFQKSDEF